MATRYLLNSPVLTAFGTYRFNPIDLESAKAFVAQPFTSAIGHPAAALFLENLLGVDIPIQRITIAMQPGDQALVLRLAARLAEGKILSAEEMRELPFDLGLLERL